MQQNTVDPLAYYDLERYLSEQVSPRFHNRGYINAFDFFSIVIWKANRAKSVTAHRLMASGKTQGLFRLDGICAAISHTLCKSDSEEARFQLLVSEWKFLLPMASAILTVLYPKRFTVYDYRVVISLHIAGSMDSGISRTGPTRAHSGTGTSNSLKRYARQPRVSMDPAICAEWIDT